MVALLIAALTATSLLWSSAADAHAPRPVMPARAAVPTGPTAPPQAEIPPPATDSGLLLLVVLGATVGASCLARRRRRPAAALTTACLLVVLLAASAPHMVHHAFEPGKGADCQVLQVASHADGTVDGPDAPPMVMASVRLDPDPRRPAVTTPPPVARTRAPPA